MTRIEYITKDNRFYLKLDGHPLVFSTYIDYKATMEDPSSWRPLFVQYFGRNGHFGRWHEFLKVPKTEQPNIYPEAKTGFKLDVDATINVAKEIQSRRIDSLFRTGKLNNWYYSSYD